MRLEAALEPPSPVVMLSTVVVEAGVVVAVVSAERLVVVVLTQRHGISRIAVVTVDVQPVSVTTKIFSHKKPQNPNSSG